MRGNKVLLIFGLVIIFIVTILFLGGAFHNNRRLLSSLNKDDYKDVDYLVIVAHPDDEDLTCFIKIIVWWYVLLVERIK